MISVKIISSHRDQAILMTIFEKKLSFRPYHTENNRAGLDSGMQIDGARAGARRARSGEFLLDCSRGWGGLSVLKFHFHNFSFTSIIWAADFWLRRKHQIQPVLVFIVLSWITSVTYQVLASFLPQQR